MKYLKKFERFLESGPEVKPAQPTTKPGTKERPSRPSPIRRDRPAPGTEPAPKAMLPKASAEEVTNKFIELAKKEGFDFKKYFDK
jgi:hypothetical protein